MSDEAGKFQIFRMADAPVLEESHAMTFEGVTQDVQSQFNQLCEAGLIDGQYVKVLADVPGFSLIYSWFKAGFPLPLHSHDSDCMYYIVAGSIRLGTNDLGPGDSFFVPKDVPYTYSVGADGLEILEFRNTGTFNFRFVAKATAPYWSKAMAQVADHREEWMHAKRPSEMVASAPGSTTSAIIATKIA